MIWKAKTFGLKIELMFLFLCGSVGQIICLLKLDQFHVYNIFFRDKKKLKNISLNSENFRNSANTDFLFN